MGLRRSRRVFAHNSFECVSQFLCFQPCHAHLTTFPTHLRWHKISSWREKTCCTPTPFSFFFLSLYVRVWSSSVDVFSHCFSHCFIPIVFSNCCLFFPIVFFQLFFLFFQLFFPIVFSNCFFLPLFFSIPNVDRVLSWRSVSCEQQLDSFQSSCQF